MTNGSNLVTIRDIDVPFWRIVMILVKWSIASIPAMIILILLLAVLTAIVGGALSLIGLEIPEVPTPPSQPLKWSTYSTSCRADPECRSASDPHPTLSPDASRQPCPVVPVPVRSSCNCFIRTI